jgi:hypothetical protein
MADEEASAPLAEEAVATEIKVVPPDYPWTSNTDEDCRTFIFERMASPEIDGAVLVDNMDRVYHWLRFHKKLPKKPSLKSVEKES